MIDRMWETSRLVFLWMCLMPRFPKTPFLLRLNLGVTRRRHCRKGKGSLGSLGCSKGGWGFWWLGGWLRCTQFSNKGSPGVVVDRKSTSCDSEVFCHADVEGR